MPTNLPPEYFEVEKRYKSAESVGEKIACLEEMLSTIPKHKGTDKLRADYRRRLSKLKTEAQTKKGASKQVSAFRIDREGPGQAVVIGHDNVGKSSLVRRLTNATPEVSEVPFTTWQPSPGMMPVEDIQVQLIDTPPLNREYVEPELFDLIRRTDIILLMVDLQADPFTQLEETIASLEEHRIIPQHKESLYTEKDRLTFVDLIVLANKCDDSEAEADCQVFAELLEEDWPLLPVSAETGHNLDLMKIKIFNRLEIIRVYSKEPGQEPDLGVPFVMKRGSTVEELAGNVHQDFYHKLKSARIWGSGAFDGQMVPRDYVLQDGDVVELRI
jgi:ribosome-interacting GTPase 1